MLIIGYPTYFLSFLTPRNNKKILVGSHVGFTGNAKYIFLYANEHLKSNLIIWIAFDKKERDLLRSYNYISYRRNSFKGFFHCLTSAVYLFTLNVRDINFWTSGGTKKINLWHGVGLKQIGFNLKEGPNYKVYHGSLFVKCIARILLPYRFAKPDIVISTSEYTSRNIFASAFRVPVNRCYPFGYSRNDLFFKSPSELKNLIDKYEPDSTKNLKDLILKYDSSFIYMPTWRDIENDFIDESKIDFYRINEIMKDKNAIFLLKLHPNTKLKLNLKIFSNLLTIDSNVDIYPILPFVSVMITDYSSAHYDFILMKDKKVILFPFDLDEYIKNNRGLQFDYKKYSPGSIVYDVNELYKYIMNDYCDMSNRDWIIEKFWGDYNGNASERILSLIKELTYV
jgi:CDP-glycerol glycerophosphotransferase (TagB/SpsB family)